MRPPYSEGVHRLLRHAQEYAGDYRHRFVHSEYLLLALLTHRNSATRLLEAMSYDCGRLRRECKSRCRRGEHKMEGGLKMTPRVQQIMGDSAEEMRELGDTELDTRHILLGMLRAEEGVAMQVLHEAGLTFEAAKTAVISPETAAEFASSGDSASRVPFWKKLLRA